MDCAVHWLGEVPFLEAWELQKQFADEVARGSRPATLLLLEHPHTFSLGTQGQLENLLWSQDELDQRCVAVVWTDRGGDITYHGPGQLVGYPILPLGTVDRDKRLPHTDYVGYLRRLEDVLIRALAGFGIASGQIAGKTGVWVQPDVASRCRHCPPEARHKPSKIASIGVKVDVNGISRHGFALNMAPDMTYWDGIVACGLVDDPAISMEQLMNLYPDSSEVIHQTIRAFGSVFNLTMDIQSIPESILPKEQEGQP
jgi:lipoate-protein ligase B